MDYADREARLLALWTFKAAAFQPFCHPPGDIVEGR